MLEEYLWEVQVKPQRVVVDHGGQRPVQREQQCERRDPDPYPAGTCDVRPHPRRRLRAWHPNAQPTRDRHDEHNGDDRAEHPGPVRSHDGEHEPETRERPDPDAGCHRNALGRTLELPPRESRDREPGRDRGASEYDGAEQRASGAADRLPEIRQREVAWPVQHWPRAKPAGDHSPELSVIERRHQHDPRGTDQCHATPPRHDGVTTTSCQRAA